MVPGGYWDYGVKHFVKYVIVYIFFIHFVKYVIALHRKLLQNNTECKL